MVVIDDYYGDLIDEIDITDAQAFLANRPHATMRQLGKLYGVSSHVIGKRLKEIGLRGSDGNPTCSAKTGRFTKMIETPNVTFWVWRVDKTMQVLESLGGLKRKVREPS